MTGKISHIQRFSVGDGPGIRSTVFFKGCPLHCLWCHNPETISPDPVLMFHQSLCTSCGKCASVCHAAVHVISESGKHIISRSNCIACRECVKHCPKKALEISGKEMTADEVFSIISEDRDFYRESGGGITFSGGEPLLQPEFARELAKKCFENGISVLIDTSAALGFKSFEPVLDFADTYYVDLKAADDKDYRHFTGGSIFPVTDSISKLVKAGKDVTIRIPVIPDHNFSLSYMKRMADVIRETGAVKVDLLPFHSLCKEKYKAIGKNYIYAGTESLKASDLFPLLEAFEGFDARVTN